VRVYVAAAYSRGSVVANVRAAVAAADRLWEAGFVPFVPHLSLLYDLIAPKPYSAWLEYDLAWLACCQALVRLPGESPGADREVAAARAQEIPVFLSVDALLARYRS
jgi:hypothetical protein